MKKAVVLLSGGLDSTTTLYWMKRKGFKPYCLIFDYGQRHRREINSAIKIANQAKVDYKVVRFKLPWGGSSLLDQKFPLPRSRTLKEIGGDIPSTYVPARNTIFLSFALSYAEAIGAERIFIGANAIDFSGYPDCRPEYYRVWKELIKKGIKSKEQRALSIETPLIKKTKAEIVKLGIKLKVPFELTWSCYQGGSRPCGRCDSCILRAQGFRKARVIDPLLS